MLRVTNNSGEDFRDRYNGVDYTFPAGGSITVSIDAAKHIFGFGAPDKLPFLTRLGWVRSSLDTETAMQRMNAFAFSSADEPEPEVATAGETVDSLSVTSDPQPSLMARAKEQGLAPLQNGADEEAATDGAVESSVPIPSILQGKKGRSILDQLSGG